VGTDSVLGSRWLPPSQEELLAAVALDIQAMTQHKQNRLGHFKPRGGQQVPEELKGVNQLVTAKATPEEAEAFRRWLLAAAQAAADAGKEGGFLGFGGEQLSAGTSGCWTKCAPRSRWPEPSTPFSPASGDAGRTPGPKNGRRRVPGVLPRLPGRSGGGRRCGRLGCCRGQWCPRPGTGEWNPAPLGAEQPRHGSWPGSC
jgi:hypothetical protein